MTIECTIRFKNEPRAGLAAVEAPASCMASQGDQTMIARTRTFALWLALMAGWFMTSPTGGLIRQIFDL